jgi:hypothetical protein
MKAAIIAAIVSAALASATATAATIVVTSKNIKNGTIQLVDISPKAKKALRGQRGPRGPQGIQTITEVRSPPNLIPPGVSSSAEASCPAGERPISGGFGGSPSGGMTIVNSTVSPSRAGWLVIAVNESTRVDTVGAVAYCSPNVTITPQGTP